MVFAFIILYVMKCLKIISFTSGAGELESNSNNSVIFVSFRTLAKTLPLALTYLLFMVSVFQHFYFSVFVLDKKRWTYNMSFLQLFSIPCFIIGCYHGSSARHKHSHVHDPQANCSGLHNGYGVFSVRAESFKLCYWKVCHSYYSSSSACIWIIIGNYK